MTKLPHSFKTIRLELARSKDFPEGSTTHGYELVAPLDASGHIDSAVWQNIASTAALCDFGAKTRRPGGWYISLVGPSTHAGSSIMTAAPMWTTRPATGSALIHSRKVITFQFAMKTTVCIRSA